MPSSTERNFADVKSAVRFQFREGGFDEREEVRSFRHLVRQRAVPMPARHESYVLLLGFASRVDLDISHELPPAVPPPQQQGAGVGPAFSNDVNTGPDVDEPPGSALERELGQHGFR